LRRRRSSYIKLILYGILVVLINLAGLNLFMRADLTGNGLYSLSEASRRVVSTLSEPLTIKVFFTRNLPAPYNSTERYLRDLLEEYGIYGNRYFNYQFYDINPEGASGKARESEETAQNYGIHPLQIQHIEQDEVKFKKAYMGMILIHGDLVEKIPAITGSEGLEYRITTAIMKLNDKISALLALKGKVSVKLFLSSSLNRVAPYMGVTELPQLPRKIEDIVKSLNVKSYDKLEFACIDPEKGEAEKAEAEIYRLMSLKWPALEEGRVEAGQGVIGLVMEYGGKTAEIPIMNVVRIPIFGTRYSLMQPDQVRELVEGNLDGLINIHENIGYLADHGTLETLSVPGMESKERSGANFHALLSRNYTVREVRLKDGPLVDNIDCLVIAGPRDTFSDYELFQIDQFLMKGKNLALFVDPFEETSPQANRSPQFNPGGTFVPLETGLEKLIEHYGASVTRAFVLDENSYRQRMAARFGGGERPVYFAPIIKNRNINHDPPYMENIRGLVVMKIAPLELNEERLKAGGLSATGLFSSSERSWTAKQVSNLNALFMQSPPPDKEMKKYPLACVLQGEFPSYFKGKPLPEKEMKETNENGKESSGAPSAVSVEQRGAVIEQGKPGRIFLIGTSEILTDQMVDEQGTTPNSVFLLNIVDHLNNRDDIAVMRGKEQSFNPLQDTSAWAKTAVKTFNIAGLPILVVFFGLAVWFRRTSRKKAIQALFQSAREG